MFSADKLKDLIRRCLYACGLDIRRFHPEKIANLRRRKFITDSGIDVVIDIGANEGQYAIELRRWGYSGRIVSFEPLSSAFEKLHLNAQRDERWTCEKCAIGAEDGKTLINVSENSVSSSILPMLDRHVKSAPTSKYVATEEVLIRCLDSVFSDIVNSSEKVLLKIDVQGFERALLSGAREALTHVDLIEIELSLSRLYEDQPLIDEMLNFMRDHGFSLISLEQVFADPERFHILQVDGIFQRQRSPE